jgi:UDP-N-acetylmuramyl pentapeptide phosphotransferase/UDP-N-acetylglucosamine-1-phosphate transferase
MTVGWSATTAFAAALAGSAAASAAWIAFARRRQWVDAPGARRLHAMPTPRGAGIGIALVMALAFLAWSTPWMAAGIAVFAFAGLLDDLRSPPAWTKLLMQLAAAGLLVAAFEPVWLLGVVLVLVVTYLVNACNFMDGSNGLLAGQGLVIALALALWPQAVPGLPVLAWCLAGACLGFLPFNVPKARGFLGDVGSHAIGASLAALLLAAVLGGALPVPAALLMLTPMLVDTLMTLGRRALAGKPVWRAHREHLYQYAVRRGHSHGRVALAYAAWVILGVCLALVGVKLRSTSVMWALSIVNAMVGVAAYVLLRRHWLRTRREGVA